MFSLMNSVKHLSKTKHQFYINSFRKKEEVGSLSKSFYKISMALISKPDKDITRKQQVNIPHQHWHKKSLRKFQQTESSNI